MLWKGMLKQMIQNKIQKVNNVSQEELNENHSMHEKIEKLQDELKIT